MWCEILWPLHPTYHCLQNKCSLINNEETLLPFSSDYLLVWRFFITKAFLQFWKFWLYNCYSFGGVLWWYYQCASCNICMQRILSCLWREKVGRSIIGIHLGTCQILRLCKVQGLQQFVIDIKPYIYLPEKVGQLLRLLGDARSPLFG